MLTQELKSLNNKNILQAKGSGHFTRSKASIVAPQGPLRSLRSSKVVVKVSRSPTPPPSPPHPVFHFPTPPTPPSCSPTPLGWAQPKKSWAPYKNRTPKPLTKVVAKRTVSDFFCFVLFTWLICFYSRSLHPLLRFGTVQGTTTTSAIAPIECTPRQ
jgi:hypothetical protein